LRVANLYQSNILSDKANLEVGKAWVKKSENAEMHFFTQKYQVILIINISSQSVIDKEEKSSQSKS
jgi:hypothetical protein